MWIKLNLNNELEYITIKADCINYQKNKLNLYIKNQKIKSFKIKDITFFYIKK